MPSYNEISPNQLMRLIGPPNAPGIIDTRIGADFDADPRLIPTAQQCPHDKIETLVPELTGKRVVVACQKGKKLSQGAAALLRSYGIAAETLADGHFAWRDAGLPLVPATAMPRPLRGAVWVTRHRPKIDRIACPWLIRRFIDPAAKFLFVPPADVELVAENFGGTPFDIEGVQWSHRDERCTFDVMIEDFKLDMEPLHSLATIVRAADTNRHELAPEAAGLLAISVGLSRAYKDDIAQLEAGMGIYDALYRWARDGKGEGHSWPADKAACA